MGNKICIIIIIGIFVQACGERSAKLNYEDYNPNNFEEVVATITRTSLGGNPTDFPRKINIEYKYSTKSNSEFMTGTEKNLRLKLDVGDSIVVLVHKLDESVSFFGYIDPRLRYAKFKNAKGW